MIEEQVERIRAAGRQRARALRALGRRRLRGRRAARAQGGRRPAHVRVRRPRPAAQGRGRAGGRDVRRPLPRAARARRRRRSASSPGSPASTDPEEKRKRIGEEFIRVFEDEARKLGDVTLARAGDALLRRDRVGRHRRRRRDDQVAPQRRRPAGRHDDEARRAAAPALQGRGAPRRRGARHAGADGLAPAVPGPRPRDPDHRRRHRGAARDAARGRRDPAGGGPPRRPLPRALAVVLRAAGDPLGRRAGRLAHVRLPDRDPRRHLGRRDDGRLGAAARTT